MGSIHIPPYLRFECLRCGKCCRGWPIGLTRAEHERLADYAWERVEPQLAGRQLFVGSSGRARTALRANGDCVFLGEQNTCLVHKHLGLQSKPLGCRLYPFTVTPTPSGTYIGARFSCPAIAHLRGQSLASLHEEFAMLCRDVPAPAASAESHAGVPFRHGAPRMPWSDVQTVDKALDDVLGYGELTLGQRVRVVERLVGQLCEADMGKLSGRPLAELLELIVPAFAQEVLAEDRPPPTRLEQTLMSQFFGFIHSQAPIDFLVKPMLSRAATRWRLFRQRARFAALTADVAWHDAPRPVGVADVWRAGPLPLAEAASDLLLTYLKVKLFAKSALGEPAGAYPYLYGIRLNVAFLAAAAWFAKARALARGEGQVECEDVTAALEHVDAAYTAQAGAGSSVARGRALGVRHGEAIANVAAAIVDAEQD